MKGTAMPITRRCWNNGRMG